MTGDPLRPLLESAAEGDDVALARLVRCTQADVWRLCSALGTPGEVEDLVQETYLRMLRAVPAFRAESSVRTWLLAIARHVCADDVRGRERRRRLLRRIMEQPFEIGELPPPDPETLLDSLTPPLREAFVLTQMLGLPYAEAAEILCCPVGTIRSRVSRARAELMGVLEAEAQLA